MSIDGKPVLPLRSLGRVRIRTELDPAFASLRDGGSRYVPGEGTLNPPVAFVGEAPGRNEDEQGRPFIGAAGTLLRRLITDELGLEPEQVWITNIVKYRPAMNRTPVWAELEAGARHLKDELEVVKPAVVVTLGSSALSLLRPQPITRIHGQPFTRGGRTYLPMFHPAYLLRRQDLMPVYREDFAQLRRLLNLREDRP